MTTLDEAQVAELAQLVGAAPETDGATLVAAVREALEEQAEDGAITWSAAVAALRDAPGPKVTVVDAGALEEMQAGLRELAELRAERDDQVIVAALRKGFITPAMKPGWQAQMRRDPEGTKAELAKLKTPIVPMKALGHDAGGSEFDPNQQPGWSDGMFGHNSEKKGADK